MQPSSNILDYIKTTEAYRPTAYLPTPQDVPTIGYGSTGPDVKLGMTWTRAQCIARFLGTCSTLAQQMTNALGATPTTQNQFDAMFSLAYNIGIGHFLTSSVLRDHKARAYSREDNDFLMWIKQAGKTLGGLVTRRKKEASIYDA
jgi:lysozyme